MIQDKANIVEMDKEHYQRIHNRARELAKTYGASELADDFAQVAAYAISQGRKATIHQLWIDFIRKEFGSYRSDESAAVKAVTELKNKERRYGEELTDRMSGSYESVFNSDIKYLQNLLEGEERIIFTCIMFYGFTLKEVGDAFGVSEGRICQRFSELQKKLVKKAKKLHVGIA